MDTGDVLKNAAQHSGEKSFFKKKPKFKFRDLAAAVVKQAPKAISAWQDYKYKKDRPGTYAPKATKREAIANTLNLLLDTGVDITKNVAKTNKWGHLYKAFADKDEIGAYEKRKADKRAKNQARDDRRYKQYLIEQKLDLDRRRYDSKGGTGSGTPGRKGMSVEERKQIIQAEEDAKTRLLNKRYELSGNVKKDDFDRNSKYKDPIYKNHVWIAEHADKYDPESHSLLLKNPSLAVYLKKQGSGQDAYYELPPSVIAQYKSKTPTEQKKANTPNSNSKGKSKKPVIRIS
jgi:hypothetical protein